MAYNDAASGSPLPLYRARSANEAMNKVHIEKYRRQDPPTRTNLSRRQNELYIKFGHAMSGDRSQSGDGGTYWRKYDGENYEIPLSGQHMYETDKSLANMPAYRQEICGQIAEDMERIGYVAPKYHPERDPNAPTFTQLVSNTAEKFKANITNPLLAWLNGNNNNES